MYCLIVFVIVILIFWYSKSQEMFSNPIEYMSKDDVIKFLMKDGDGYLSRLKPMDFMKRNVSGLDEYKENIKDVVIDFTSKQKKILEKAVRRAQEIIDSKNSKYIESDLLSRLEWIFALTTNKNGKQYEMGLPHTRQNVIFFTPDVIFSDRIEDTLVHEKIHVYQKVYKNKFQKVLLKNGYKIVGLRENSNFRSNPDLDEHIYEKDGVLMRGEFESEHPNEEIAYSY